MADEPVDREGQTQDRTIGEATDEDALDRPAACGQ
jgi:hypothetical protein